MGGSGKWIKSLIGLKKQGKSELEKAGGERRKWKRLWSSSSDLRSMWKGSTGSGRRSASEASDSSSVVADVFSTAVAAVVRAPAKDFMAVRQEWSAGRIQTAFRCFLAKRALRALKGIVRIQALVRGRQVRRQAALTFKCMQALVRVQALVRARRVKLSNEGRVVQKMLENRSAEMNPLKEIEEGWCDSQGTLAHVKAKLQMRQEGAIKRERAVSYSISHQQCGSSSRGRSNTSLSSLKHQDFDKNNGNWSWLDRWMAVKSWETRLMKMQAQTEPSENECNNIEYTFASRSKLSEITSKAFQASSVNIKKNNISTRVSAKLPPMVNTNIFRARSSSSPSSEFLYGESSASSSSFYISTPILAKSFLVSERVEDSKSCKSNYMKLTESIKAKQRNCTTQRI